MVSALGGNVGKLGPIASNLVWTIIAVSGHFVLHLGHDTLAAIVVTLAALALRRSKGPWDCGSCHRSVTDTEIDALEASIEACVARYEELSGAASALDGTFAAHAAHLQGKAAAAEAKVRAAQQLQYPSSPPDAVRMHVLHTQRLESNAATAKSLAEAAQLNADAVHDALHRVKRLRQRTRAVEQRILLARDTHAREAVRNASNDRGDEHLRRVETLHDRASGLAHRIGRLTHLWFVQAQEADDGHVDAQLWLGVCYAEGQCVAQSYDKAVVWLRKAAEQGHPDAQYRLSVCYANGWGVTRKSADATSWLHKAAAQRHPDALGTCFESWHSLALASASLSVVRRRRPHIEATMRWGVRGSREHKHTTH